jgi:hypothetical protein
MQVSLVACLALILVFYTRFALYGPLPRSMAVERNVGRGPHPRPMAPTGVGGDQARRFYRFISTDGLVATGAKGLVACSDTRVVPLLVAVCDEHDPSLADQGLTPLWAADALSRLVGETHTVRGWVRWFDRRRADFAACRFLHRYRVRPGDTLWRISRRVYGTGDGAHRLHEHNLAVIPKRDSLAPGQVLTIPH